MEEEKHCTGLPRRELLTLPLMAALGAEAYGSKPTQEASPAAQVPPNPSPDELRIIHDSSMAQDVFKFFWAGYNCAETGLGVSLRFLKKPDDLVWMAAGFGGGLGQKDLCGFLTSGIMAIGLYAGTLNVERKEAVRISAELARSYWSWWPTLAPHHCSDIQQGRACSNVCTRVGCLAMAKLEELLKEHASTA
jgi:C_GCAxxG_C_C family probable redox protein